MKKNSLILSVLFIVASVFSYGQSITITNTQTPEELVDNVLAGTGVVISNVTFNYSAPLAGAIQTQAGYFNYNSTTFPIEEGVILATGNVILAEGPNDATSATDNSGVAVDPNDADLNSISTATVNNECILEFDFVPSGDSIIFNYLFASEEYPEYSPSTFNDAFGFFISGPGFAGPFTAGAENIAMLPSPVIPVTINNVNPTTNPTYYVSNAGGTATQYDGHTVVLTAAAQVQCGETYHIKLAIGDAGDQSFDSAVFLEASSFSSNGVSVEIASATGSAAITEGCDSAIVTFIRPSEADTTTLDIDYIIGGTATNGTDYPFLNGTVSFPIGEDTVEFYVTPIADALVEGTETVTISVEIINACGDTITTEATFEIIDPLPFNVLPTDVNIDCPTATVDIGAAPDGGVPAFTYDWGAFGSGTTATVPGNIVGTTTYNVDITDACGVTATGAVDVTLIPAPEPTITFNQNTFTICPGQTADIDATVNNPYSAPVGYSWAPTGETTEDISVSPAVVTWYYLTIDDGCYNVTDSVKVELGGVDLTNIIVTPATDCPGQPLATPGSIQIEPDNATWTYEIITYAPPQNSGFFPGLDGGINYIVNVTDDLGCSTDTVVFLPLGANAVTADFVMDSLRDVTCFGAANGGAYVENIAGGITAPYDVTWTHITGLFDSETVAVGGNSEQDNLFGGTWVVTVTDQEGCAWSTPFDIYEPDELTLDFISNDPTCFGFNDGSITVNTSGGNGSNIYTITDSVPTQLNSGNTNAINNLVTGWYYAAIVDANGCATNDSIFIDEPGELDIDLTIDQPLCYGIASGYVEVDSVYNATGDYGQIGYFWNPNPSGIVNGIGATWINQLGEGSYLITINDENGCSKEFAYDIVYPAELVWSQIGYEPAYCRQFYYQSGNGVVYAAAAGGTPDYSYLWTNLGTGATSTNTTWGGLNPGEYQIVATDDNSCTLTQIITLDSLNPIAAFTPSSAQFLTPGVCEGTAIVEVNFVNNSENFANPNNPSADTTFFWNFNTPDPATTGWVLSEDWYEQFDTIYADSGSYNVCLVAINKNGCTDTTCKIILVHDPLTFTPINVFTPNGDGVNDVFTFENWATAVATFECIIVDRWGVQVADLQDITDAWDGTNYAGNLCPDGIYYYTYSGVATDGTVFSGQGFTHIVDGQ